MDFLVYMLVAIGLYFVAYYIIKMAFVLLMYGFIILILYDVHVVRVTVVFSIVVFSTVVFG